jgi:hypothetical protein
MSISYTLRFAGRMQPAELAKRLCSTPDYQQSTEDIIAPGLLVRIGQLSPPEIEMIEEEFQFTPTAVVTFFRDKETDPVTVRTNLLRGCVALLEGNTDDAVLLLNGEVVILLRRNGRLALNKIEGFWTEAELAVIPAPIEFESIPSI